MNQNDYNKLLGKLEGLREASSVPHNYLHSRIETLESQIKSAVVTDEVAELKAQLAKAIVPKFEVGQEVWFCVHKGANRSKIRSYIYRPDPWVDIFHEGKMILCCLLDNGSMIPEARLFPNEIEALSEALKSLEGKDDNSK